MTHRISNRIFLVLTILMMVVIFLFSSQNGEESGFLSDKVVAFILSLFKRGFSSFEESVRKDLIDEYSFLVRKLAHFSEYALLGFFFSSYLKTGESRRVFVPSLLFGFLYSITDEVHQFFLEGRNMSFFDVAVDTSGVLFGTLVSMLVFYMIGNKNSPAV